nr:MAG: polyprotein [Sichuan deltaflexi-like virus 2]
MKPQILRPDPMGRMSAPLPLAALAVAVLPFWVPIAALYILTKSFLLACSDPLQAPQSPGGCWQTVIPTHMHGVFPDPWMSRDKFKYICQKLVQFNARPFFNFPFVRIVTLRPRVHHVVAWSDPRGRLVRLSRLPPGWYGAGLDPNFYNESSLRNVILSLHMGDYTKLLTSARRSAPYAVTKLGEGFLKGAGIDLPPPHAPAHSHPVHYALRNRHMGIAARLLQGDWYALFAGPDRLNYLQTCGASNPSGTFNPRYDGKDITRHMGSSVPTISQPMSRSPIWFACDVLHHLEAGTVGSWFDSNPTLEYVVATAIIPPETCFGLPSLYPNLYTYTRSGDTLTYIPEGNVGGHYTQPYSARRWLRTNRIITPHNRCVHVSLMESNYAHHVFIISRAELVPERLRTLDMAPVTIVPWFVHPFGTLYQRLTTPGLIATLVSFSTRANSTNIRDIYSKTAQSEVALFNRFPAAYVRAAAVYAKWLRDVDYHFNPGVYSYVKYLIVMVTRLPVLPVQFYFQSYVSRLFQSDHDSPHIWQVHTHPWVSQRSERGLPGVKSGVCPNDMSLFQLPPNADRLAHYAVYSAEMCTWLAIKVCGFLLHTWLRALLHHFPAIWHIIAYLLDLHWDSSPWGVCLSALLLWFGLRGPRLHWPLCLQPPLLDWCRLIIGNVFFLPYARRRLRAGLNYYYITLLNFFLLCLAFPRFHPVVYYLDRVATYELVVDPPGVLDPLPSLNATHLELRSFEPRIQRLPAIQQYGFDNVVHLCLLTTALLLALVMVPSMPFSRRSYLPRHDLEAHSDVCCGSVCPVLSPSADTSTPVDPSTPSDRGPPPEVVEVDTVAVDLSERLDPVPPPPGDGLPPPTPFVVPAMVPGDPLRAYNLPPRVLLDYDNWLNLMTRLPQPPNTLDPATMCVWDVLGACLGLPASVVWACYVSALPAAQRAPYQTGTVPPEHLSRVITFFCLDATVRTAFDSGNVCPRGPGNAAPPGTYNPTLPPHLLTRGEPGWPALTAFLQNNDDGTYHFTVAAVPDRDEFRYLPPVRGDVIGWQSRLVPAVEVGEVVNIPSKGFGTVYRRFLGNMQNYLSTFAGAPRMGAFILAAVPVRRQTVNYVPTARDAGYARGLASDIKAHPSVLNIHEFNAYDTARTLDQMAKQYHGFVVNGTGIQYPAVRFHLYHGAYGTGKTFQLALDLAQEHARVPFTPSTLAFHTWDHDLRDTFMNGIQTLLPQIGLQTSNFMTGCMPLAQPRTGTVVFDDAGKCWNSFIPLFLACNPGVTDVYLTFDACQAQGSFPNAPAISRGHLATSAWLSPMSDYYATNVVRTAGDVTDLFGLPRAAPIPGRVAPRGQVIIVSQSPADVPLLAVSPRFTQTQSMGGQVASTFTEAQGHTIHGDVCIDLGGLTATTTEAAAWTALTRATGNIYLKMGPAINTPGTIETCWSKSQILSSMLAVARIQSTPYLTAAADVDGLIRSAVLSHMSRCLSPAAAQRLGLPAPNPIIGVSRVSADVRASWLNAAVAPSDVYTARTHRARLGYGGGASGKAFSRHTATVSHHSTSPVADIVRHYTPLSSDSILSAPSTGYSLPAPTRITVEPDPVDDINDPTDDVMREAFIETNPYNSTTQHIHDGAPDALHHTRADKLTDILGKRKRIRVGVHDQPWSSSDERRLKSLKAGFSKLFDVAAWNNEPFNGPLMEHCERHKLASWASKRTKRALQASVDKQDIDAPFNFVRLFPKGQFIKKKAKWRSNAFPSQTISDFNLGRIFEDSPMALYLETQALRHAHDTTYLHCRASPDDVSRWYKLFWRPGLMTGNDYTAWDSGVDHVFVEFDIWLMQLCHFPEWYVQRYRSNRLTTYSHLGTHLPRQESGDRWTWILNSLRNAALTGASLDFPPRTPTCISGDDSVTLGAWRRTTGFNPDDWLMKPKREEGTTMEFCGLIFGGPDVSFDPSVVHWRSRFGLQQGRSDVDYWRSIRDAIIETSSKLGGDSRKLAGARLNLQRAICWFNLPSSLSLPGPLPDPPHHFDTLLTRCGRFLRKLLFAF